MKRRAFVAGLAAAGALPRTGYGQQSPRICKIGLLWPGDSAPHHPRVEWFRQGLAESGYIEGQNVALEIRYGARGVERLPQLATELVRLDVDVVAAFGIQAARAMQRSTATIPIVVMTDELVGHGLVVSLSRPGAIRPAYRSSRQN
jgi:putative ABC transport system substrate-binding protein